MDKNKHSIKRVGSYLHRIVPVFDKTGKVINYALKPFMVEFRLRDVLQIGVGAMILAIPVGFTEEVWNLSETLPLINIIALSLFSLFFISLFVFYNFYRFHFKEYSKEYFKRVISTYVISLLVVTLFLTIIQKCPWGTDNLLAIKRIILVGFPASMSGTISDIMK